MYIAIEGIKGTGKSTILNGLQQMAAAERMQYGFFPITAPMPGFHPLELEHKKNPAVRWCDSYMEQLFAARSYWHQQHVSFKGGMVLGDRSVLTSYVTRWNKWGNPYYTISRVETIQKNIRKPDVIIWLESNPAYAIGNICKRAPKGIGMQDEQACRLLEASDAYAELVHGRVYQRKIEKADIIRLPAASPAWELTNEIFSIIKHYRH